MSLVIAATTSNALIVLPTFPFQLSTNLHNVIHIYAGFNKQSFHKQSLEHFALHKFIAAAIYLQLLTVILGKLCFFGRLRLPESKGVIGGKCSTIISE